MAAELITPTDTLTGIPLPILPQEWLPINDPARANQHHSWHPSTAPELLTPAGLALRHSRVQLVRATDHNMGDKTKGKLTYHDFYVGPKLPIEEAEIFRMCVLACAGYIPDRAIDLRNGSPVDVPMNERQMRILRKPAVPQQVYRSDKNKVRNRAAEAYSKLINPPLGKEDYTRQTVKDFVQRREAQAGFHFRHLTYSYEPLRDFFRKHALDQDLKHIKDLRVEEFLLTKDQDRKMHLGRWLLAQAVEKTTDAMEQTYSELRNAGRLHPQMPAEARLLVLYKLGRREDRTQLVVEAEKTIKARLGLVA